MAKKQMSLFRARHTTAKKRYKRAIPRHAFPFEVPLNNGKIQKVKILAKVRHATKAVDLELTEPDVDKAMKMKGRGNMATCAMAQCADRLSEQFPHGYVGFIDWLLKTTFVASKLNAQGLPIECYKYEHRDNVAHLFDDKDGEKMLIAKIRENGGKLVIKLKPARFREGESTKGGNVPATGKRSDPKGFTRRTIRWAKGEGLAFDNLQNQ